MPDIVIDNGVVGFSRILTINSVTYSTDDFQYSIPTGAEFDRTDHKSRWTGSAYAKGKPTGSATLQLATAATALPEWGMQFTESEGVWNITSVGKAQTKNGLTTVPISFALTKGAITTE